MQGRLENKIKREKVIENLLKDMNYLKKTTKLSINLIVLY